MRPFGQSPPRLPSLTYLAFQVSMWLKNDQHGITFDDIYDSLDNDTF